MIKGCDLFYFYIKPQQSRQESEGGRCCDLFYFYIKPQQVAWLREMTAVVTYSISTSNHNAGYIMRLFPRSYIVLTINKMDSELPAKCV